MDNKKSTLSIETRIFDTNQADPLKYAVITPVRDEAIFIERTIYSMIHQTIKPSVWVIVNDGSKDDTGKIIQQYISKYDWIKLVNQADRGVRQRGQAVIEAFYAGYNTLDERSDFIVKLDGDVSFEPDYFESLLWEFAEDPMLGIAGGCVYEQPDGETWVRFTNKDEVRGCTKMYRQACFEDIGGLIPAMGWDGIDEWTALSLGWKVRSFIKTKMFHYRFTGTATGQLRSFIEQGNGAYRIGYHPIYLVARAIRLLIDRPYFIGGMALFIGFVQSWLHREKRLTDPSVIRYVRQTQINKLAGLITGKPVHET